MSFLKGRATPAPPSIAEVLVQRKSVVVLLDRRYILREGLSQGRYHDFKIFTAGLGIGQLASVAFLAHYRAAAVQALPRDTQACPANQIGTLLFSHLQRAHRRAPFMASQVRRSGAPATRNCSSSLTGHLTERPRRIGLGSLAALSKRRRCRRLTFNRLARSAAEKAKGLL